MFIDMGVSSKLNWTVSSQQQAKLDSRGVKPFSFRGGARTCNDDPAEAKVANLGPEASLRAPVEQDVLFLEVTVHDIVLVHVVEAACDLHAS